MSERRRTVTGLQGTFGPPPRATKASKPEGGQVSASQYRSQLDRKRKQRMDAEKRAGDFRSKESRKRAEADKARRDAASTRSDSTARSKLREADRKSKEAEAAGKEAARWSDRAAKYASDEVTIQRNLTRAENTEATAAERKRRRQQQQADRRAAAEHLMIETRLRRAEDTAAQAAEAMRTLPMPKPEKLRVLVLGASADGGLRVGREAKRIRAAVESALHRDHIELDVRPAATTGDLLDGISKFRPHVVHFSGHSNETLIEFEKDIDHLHDEGAVVTAAAFAKAVKATDDPPLLVLLNSCKSAAQLPGLVPDVAPFAVGMADSIEDADAINYAAQFYSAVANGQSIGASHASGQAALELAGLRSADLPTLQWADDVDPSATVLVEALPAT